MQMVVEKQREGRGGRRSMSRVIATKLDGKRDSQSGAYKNENEMGSCNQEPGR